MLTRRACLSLTAAVLVAFSGVASISRADGARHANYIDTNSIVLVRVLPAPPAAGSAAERAELDAMLAIQAARTTAQADRAREDATISVFRFADALGSPAQFTAGKLPRFTAFFDKIAKLESAIVRPAKQSFDRKRPYEVEPHLKPVISLLGSLAYPSGHATWSFAAGLVLADMVPEKREQILERAAEFANNRVVAGVHYPSDIDTGRISGSVLAAFLFASPEFRADEKLAGAELRAGLSWPRVSE